jgi:DNA-binding winged helix-turn-helix (wHTH) protein
MILEHVWNSSFEGLTNVVDVYISALRSKLDRDFPEKLIRTNRGTGYTFTCANWSSPNLRGLLPQGDAPLAELILGSQLKA